MQDIKTRLEELITIYGPDAVIAAVKQATSASVPKNFNPLVAEDKLAASMYQLDTAIGEVLDAGTQQEAAYQDKAVLMQRSRQLETEIQLAEANALMQVQGAGRDAYAMVGGSRIALTNDAARDAYRRHASKDLRTDKAQVEAQIASIDVNLAKARDAFTTKQEALNGVRVKANLQAAILAYLK